MLWIITADKIAEPGERNFTGTLRTHSAQRQSQWRASTDIGKDVLRSKWARECEDEFRLLDADNNVYYEGVCKDLDGQPEEAAFEPMDWARGAGVTEMQYRKKGETEWKTL